MPPVAAAFAATALSSTIAAAANAPLTINGSGFVVAPGEQAVAMGDPVGGLEVWDYPLQLLSDHPLAFRTPGRVAAPD